MFKNGILADASSVSVQLFNYTSLRTCYNHYAQKDDIIITIT